VLDTIPEPLDDGSTLELGPDALKLQAVSEVDPGWALALSRRSGALDPLASVADRPWWLTAAGSGLEAITRLWRHSVAVGQAARRLAREAGESDPDRIGRAGLLHGLGRWAVTALDPEFLVLWLDETDPRKRRELEHQRLGMEMTTLGRTLAERWECDPLVADSAWLHADRDGGLSGCAADPGRLAIIQEAFAWAERTPWSLAIAEAREPIGGDPRLRVLIAEVQVRCGSAFVDADATPREERLARSNARLRRQVAELQSGRAARDRFLDALARSDPSERPETWAERAGLAWCGEPGVATARVVWTGPGSIPAQADESPGINRTTSRILPLADRGRPCAEIHLRLVSKPEASTEGAHPALAAWRAWAGWVAERARLEARLEAAIASHRDRVEREEPRLRQAKLAALAEFAAGAGHELNNPLAVIVGRAQLLLARESDPGATLMLRAILTQAQRAHRILRDLMYVARPPVPRVRFCQPDEIVRACLRDARAEAEARGIRLVGDPNGPGARVWADPDALRHLADILVRNALEATPKGGTIHVSASADAAASSLRWTVQDNGRGIAAAEGEHLFDPFYCGRQAGRGLGLGMPRAARIVAMAGGELRWHSTPGLGTTFHVHLPLPEPPAPPDAVESKPPQGTGSDQPLLKN
jgi:signal transduction histidine kinase